MLSNHFFLFRLDFENFVLNQPDTVDHVCLGDKFLVSGGPPIPAICGTNSGQHRKLIYFQWDQTTCWYSCCQIHRTKRYHNVHLQLNFTFHIILKAIVLFMIIFSSYFWHCHFYIEMNIIAYLGNAMPFCWECKM